MTVGLGFVGAGNHARHHMREFARLPGAHLKAVYDVDGERSDAAAREFSSLRRADALDDLLNDPGVEAVVIATPAETHRTLSVAALETGKHVLLEKPMAHTPADAIAIAAASERHPDLVLLVGHCERFNSAYIDARKAVTDGRVGEPRFASASRLSPLHLNNPEWALGTLDTAVHDIDLILWLVGDEPVAVDAAGVRVNPNVVIPDHVTYRIRFAHGALAEGHIGWIPFSGGYPLSGNAHPRLFLAGSAGTLSLDLWHRPVAVHTHADGSYFWPDHVLVGYGDYFTEVTAQDFAFLTAVELGQPSPVPPSDAALALGVAHAAHRSLTECGGAPISLGE